MSPSPWICRGSAGTLAFVVLGACAAASEPHPSAGPITSPCPYLAERDHAVHVLHPYLAGRVCALERRSERFGLAMQALREGDIPVYLGTPEQLLGTEPGIDLLRARMPPLSVADFAAVREPATGELTMLVVRVDLEGIRQLLRRWVSDNPRWRGTRRDLDEIVDGVLIHELWGHLVPVASARSVAANCPDPRPGQRDLDSCVMQRENELRREIGMRPRTRYAFSRWDR